MSSFHHLTGPPSGTRVLSLKAFWPLVQPKILPVLRIRDVYGILDPDFIHPGSWISDPDPTTKEEE
jgi:hypothetical protein